MRRFFEHVFFWIAFILFKVVVNLTDTAPAMPDTSVSGMLDQSLLILCSQLPYFVVYIPVVYALYYFIDRYFDGKIKLSTAVICSLIAFVTGIPALVIINHLFILPVVYHNNEYPLSFEMGSLLYYAFSLGSVVGIAGSVKLARKQWQSKILEQTLQKDKAEAELQFLKAQVSPHFLFNTLNNIYSLARKRSELTAEAVMKLSKLLRFILYDASSKFILLTDEIKLIADYVELEKLRYSERLVINFSNEIDNPSQRIAPLILIHFVENAFKHGASESRFEAKIYIEIKLVNSVLTAIFINTKGEGLLVDDNNKIGMYNTKRQLELLYPKHHLAIENESNLYTVKLTIPLAS